MQSMSILFHFPLVLAAFQAPVPVILDTDLGDDIDDTWALGMLLGCPQVNLKLIVTASDDTPTKARLVAKILENMGRTDIPIGVGKKTSERRLHQAAWLGDYSLEKYPGKIYQDGIQAMIDYIQKAQENVTLCVIGPQTNLLAALQRDPSIAKKTRVVTMAGSVYIGYDGKPGGVPEYNVYKDIEAARAVFAAPWEITMAPLDICGTLRLQGERYAKVKNSLAPRAKTVIENYEMWDIRNQNPPDASSILFDTVAAYLTFSEELCEVETIRLRIDDKGTTVPDESGRPVRCALHFKNRDAFQDLLVKSLTEGLSGY